MTVYKNEKTGKWFCIYRMKDASGMSKQIKKSGFLLKRDAEAYEHDQLANAAFQPDMTFSEFVKLYKKDVDPHLREHTIQTKDFRIKKHLIPFFGGMNLKDIDAKRVIAWQNDLIQQGLNISYMKALQETLSSIFNHAVKLYGLKANPCSLAGPPRSANEEKKHMRFWTLKEYTKVIAEVSDIKAKTAIALLYWSGMRKGELLALTWEKLDFKEGTVTIDRSYQRLKGRAVVTPTKTGERRCIMLPRHMIELLQEYKAHCFDTSPQAPVFLWEKRFIEKGIAEGCRASGVKRIHVHGLRHSHASLLIQEGVNIVLISKRLGHAKVSMTLDTYSHFYPTEEQEVMNKLNGLG